MQGFGNVGSLARRPARRHGREDRRRHRLEGRRLQRRRASTSRRSSPTPSSTAPSPASPAREPITNAELFKLDVDVLIPAALEEQITARQHARHQGEADRRGRQRPDDPGGRTSTCTSAASSSSPTSSPTPAASPCRTSSGCRTATATSGRSSEVNERLEAKMCEAFNVVLETAQKLQRRHARRRLHRGDQSRRDGDEDARDVRVGRRRFAASRLSVRGFAAAGRAPFGARNYGRF